MYADIIIDISHGKLDKTFQYIIPEHCKDSAVLGALVVVPFGQGNIEKKGYIVGISDTPNYDPVKLKAIKGVVKDSIPIEGRLILLAAWMKRNYGSTMNQALKTVIPVKKEQAAKEIKTVRLNKSEEVIRIELNEMLAKSRYSKSKVLLLEELLKHKELEWSIITQKLNVSSTNIRDLEKASLIRVDSMRTYRNPVAAEDFRPRDIKLNEVQQAVVGRVVTDYEAGLRDTYLLHGVTGSGKTEVYMEIMDHVIASGKQVIVLIPEIALTYQTLMRFFARFGDKVSVINSRMTPGERFDQFERAKNGEISVIIGPRSALFTPFSNLGLIIIDEEHETSYKSEVIPRYHAREVAIERARIDEAFVILGSATPSTESFYKASTGEFKLLSMETRVAERPLPECEIIDLREELNSGNRSMFSRRLFDLMKDRLEKKEQIMLFLNRRGMMGFVSCRACGAVIKCPHCDVSLSLHKDNTLRCHYCGYQTVNVNKCPECGSKYIGTMKAGTQKIEESLHQIFPTARVLRMDFDTTRDKDSYENILSAFAAHEADILIGTQMIVKGHDFANVTLVGVIAADISLNESNFRSSERTFSLLTQAIGRAGRGDKPGTAIIQTYQPEHFALKTAKDQDYNSFYKQEIAYRKLLRYPPVSHILQISVTGPAREKCVTQSELIAKVIRKHDENIMLLGPSDASISKVDDIYRRYIFIKDDDYDRLVNAKDAVEAFLLSQSNSYNTSTWFDFDPLSGF